MTVELKDLAYENDIVITPIVTQNTVLITTVRVNITNNGTTSEAVTDDIIVHLKATDSN